MTGLTESMRKSWKEVPGRAGDTRGRGCWNLWERVERRIQAQHHDRPNESMRKSWKLPTPSVWPWTPLPESMRKSWKCSASRRLECSRELIYEKELKVFWACTHLNSPGELNLWERVESLRAFNTICSSVTWIYEKELKEFKKLLEEIGADTIWIYEKELKGHPHPTNTNLQQHESMRKSWKILSRQQHQDLSPPRIYEKELKDSASAEGHRGHKERESMRKSWKCSR